MLFETAVGGDYDRVYTQNPLICHQLLLIIHGRTLVYSDL